MLTLEARCRPGFDLRFGLCHRLEPFFPALNFCRQTDPVRDVGLIGLLGQRQQFLHFRLELGFELLDVAMGQGAVARGVGLDLGTVQADGAQREQLHLLRHLKHLNEQAGQFVEKAPAKGGQGVVVGMRAGGDEAEGHRVIGRPLDLAAGKHAGGVAIDQQR